MDPVAIDGWCGFRGDEVARCPGYRPGPAWIPPDRLAFLPLVSVPGEGPGCAHLVPVGTARGGFRGACGHPEGNPARQVLLQGRRVARRPGETPVER